MSGNRPTGPGDFAGTTGPGPPKSYIIDTSVALKWYIPESGRDEALLYMGDGIDRHAPDLLPLEASHALLKRTRHSDPSSRMTIDEALLITEAIRDSSPIQYQPSGPLLASAFALALEIGASSYDGLFLALAILIDCPIVTADRPFHDKILASGYRHRARWFLESP